ncbi:hypothetical protein C0995_009542 [Termitomyces sp. Mi166|nr:hypothetical protein C0995_009542 [Termitomyces sp. Mi166\
MAPTFEFPAPVLSVAADVIRELEGGEALTGLWTLFTKCKASLEDGHRLENISWRLWHRELAATTPRPGCISESEHNGDGNRLVDAKTALGNEQGDNYPEMEHVPSTHVLLPPHNSIPSESLASSLSSHPPLVATVGSISTRCNNGFGKIIIDMLPNPLPPTALHPCKDASAQTDSSRSLLSCTLSQSTAPAPIADTHSLQIHCYLPTPAASELRLMPPSTLPAPESLHHVQVQIDSAPPSTPPSTLPQLVIVHPTPGPTPHPTPPASPILGFGTTSGHPKAIEAVSPVVAAACPAPKFTLHAEGSTTSSSSDSSSTSGRTNTFSLSATTTLTDSRVTVAAIVQQAKPPATAAVSRTSGNGSSLTIPAPPPSSGASPTPQPPPTHVPAVGKATPTARLSPTLASDTESSRARPRTPGHLPQTSSTRGVGGGGSNAKGKDERRKSKSRSRSRGRGDGPGRAGLMMTTAGGKRGSAATGGHGAHRGRAVGLRKGASGKGGTTGRTIAREKMAAFNVGSHSDDVGSKSAGSGSSVSGAVAVDETQQVEEGKKQKQSTLAPPQRQQSASRLMPPPLRHPLPDPATVLPSKQQQPRRTIVLATSDSDDYETETDVTESESEHGVDGARRVEAEEDGDTADWSSEDMSTDDVEFVRRGEVTQQGPGHDKKGHAQVTNHNHNHTNNTTHNRQRPVQSHHHLSRVQQSRRNHAANAQYVVEQAALEAERIREMFAKKPVPSSEDLVKQRTRSVGLLTQLMHPDPEIFPPSHPYRRGHSSGDVKGARGPGPFGGGLAMTRANEDNNENGADERGLRQGQASTRKPDMQPPQRRASAGPAPGMKLSKSAAAIPVASQVQVGSVPSVSRERRPSKESAVVDGNSKRRSVSRSRGAATNGVYRPKGRPVDQEMEDTESGEESGDPANGILVSKSVAQEKLKALAARKGIVPHDRKEHEEELVPNWARESERKGRRTSSLSEYRHSRNDASMSRQQQLLQPQVPMPTPIPLGHPYHLPPAAPPSTPRTTRRLMLQTEMSESLRRNLLWERQVSKVNLRGVRRSSSGGRSGRKGGTVLGGGPLRPLTALPSVVQLTAKRSGSASGSGSNASPRERSNASPQERERERPGSAMEEEQEREERKKRALARNRSWANEFHYTGW